LARLPTASTTHAPPLRGPGPSRPLSGTKAIRRANLRLGHRAPGRGGRRARTVSGCVNSAFLNISMHFTAHLFRPWIPNSTRCHHFLSSPTAEPCQGARQGLALPKIAYRGGYVRRTYLRLIPWLVLARRPPSEVPSSRADHISSGWVRGSHRAASPHRLA